MVLLVTALIGCGLLAAPAARAATDREEIAIDSASPQRDVVSSLVKLRVPLPASTPRPYPAACDWLQYMRYRHVDGPIDATAADAVAVLMPGLLEGATAFDIVARNTIREQARRGRHVEVWGIDRRSACVDDLTGLEAFERTGDPAIPLGYYYGNQELDGRRFAGFRGAKVLAEFGLARTIGDWYAVITSELPDPVWRRQHVICGGHSLGGPLTELLASYDADGDPRTTADAGYAQCAGYVGFDTSLASGSLIASLLANRELQRIFAGQNRWYSAATIRALRSGWVPRYVDLMGIGPETMALAEAVGLLAFREPDRDVSPILRQLPQTPTISQFFHLQAAPSVWQFLTGDQSLLDYRYSAMAMFGQVFDDNGAVTALTRASIGFFDGPVIRNRFANAANNIPVVNTFLGPGSLFLPRRQAGDPLIGWHNYDDVEGLRGTRASEEVTDAKDFARIQFEGPSNMTEMYFPVRLLADLGMIAAANRAGDLSKFPHGQGIRQSPRFSVLAAKGIRLGPPSDPHVVLPGYQHLDVLTAAERQNDGRPEGSSQAFADFIDAALANGG